MVYFFDLRLDPFSSESKAFLRSLRRRKHTLKAIRPIAITKAATAATDKPAICAGVILGASELVTGRAAVDDDDGVDVAKGREDIVSTMTDWVDVTWVRGVVVITGVEIGLEVGDVDIVRGALVTTTVRAG